MRDNSFSMIRRNQGSADRTREILGLPEDVEWSELWVEFGLDDVAVVTIKLIPTGEQVLELARLAVQPLADSCTKVVEETTENCPPTADHCPDCGATIRARFDYGRTAQCVNEFHTI